MRRLVIVIVLLAVAVSVGTAGAQTLAAAAQNVPAPDELAARVKAEVSAQGGAKVTAGSTALEFWWVAGLPLTGEAVPTWERVAEGALVGAMRVTGPFRDIRGKAVKPGVYTLRYGLQPQNGDHLGVSPFREFLLVSPAASDPSPEALGHEGTVNLAKQTLGASHPAALSLDPPMATAEPLTTYTSELGHRGLIFALSTLRDGKPPGALKFGLILMGTIEQ